MINRTETIAAFQNYTKDYNEAFTDIDRKIIHTFRVAKISELIAEGLGMDQEDIDLAWFIGILHDTGRFEQEHRYGTFVDSLSVDYAELGADILFEDGVIDIYDTSDLPDGWRDLCEKAVRLHNKLELPTDLDPRTRLFCQVIRDADKADISESLQLLRLRYLRATGRTGLLRRRGRAKRPCSVYMSTDASRGSLSEAS